MRCTVTLITTAALLAGCGVLNPVPEPALDAGLLPSGLRLPPDVMAGQATLGSKAATSTGGPNGTAANAGPCASAGDYVGGLGLAICSVDASRLDLQRRGAEVVNGQVNFNAMQWPLGAAAVFEKLRGAPNRALLLPAVMAAGAYGFVTSGIPERQAIYLAASRQLACAVVAAGPDLYFQHEIDTRVGAPLQSPPPLRQALVQLEIQINETVRARTHLLAVARPRPGVAGKAATPKSANTFDLWQPKPNGGRAAQPGADSREQLRRETAARLALAREQLDLGGKLLRRLDSGAPAAALLARAARIDADLQKALAAKAPLPAEPASTARRFIAQVPLSLQGAADDAAAPDPMDPALPDGVADGLDAGSQQALRDYQTQHAASLLQRTLAVAAWMARHRSARSDITDTLTAAGCTSSGAAEDAAALAVQAANAATAAAQSAAQSAARSAASAKSATATTTTGSTSRPATSNTSAAGTAGAAVPSGTPLAP